MRLTDEYLTDDKDMLDLPGSAADEIKKDIAQQEEVLIDAAYIHNIMFNKEWLTRQEAMMLINSISGSVLIDETRRGKSEKAGTKYL